MGQDCRKVEHILLECVGVEAEKTNLKLTREVEEHEDRRKSDVELDLPFCGNVFYFDQKKKQENV